MLTDTKTRALKPRPRRLPGRGCKRAVYRGSARGNQGLALSVPLPDLAITKLVSPDEVESGDAVTYTLEVRNNGPSDADGATVTDPGVPGSLECTALTCSAEDGAACPAAPSPAQLAAGLVIPAFPSGGVVRLELGCTVTATGD